MQPEIRVRYPRIRVERPRKPRPPNHKTKVEEFCLECGKPVPPGRRKYCSDQCARRAHHGIHAAKIRRQEKEIAQRLYKQRKIRTCLSCGGEFMSDGPWNRRCPECASRTEGGLAIAVVHAGRIETFDDEE